jgi:hypothetical protein
MDRHEGLSTNKAPLFDGSNYAFKSIRMRIHFMSPGFDVWSAVENGYKAPTTPPIDTTGKRLSDNNSKAVGAILSNLTESIFFKVMHCHSKKRYETSYKEYMKGMTK